MDVINVDVNDKTTNLLGPDPVANLYILKMTEKYINEKLKVEEVITLNEIYEQLGLDSTPEGERIRWEKHNGEWIFFELPHLTDVEKDPDFYKWNGFNFDIVGIGR